MKILIIRLSAIGDTIHCLPVASYLRSMIPGVTLGWMIEPLAAPLVIDNPAIDKVYVLPKGKWLTSICQPSQWLATLTEMGDFFSEIKKEEFDLALDMQGLLKSAVCAVASGAKRRIGFAQAREGSSLLLTDRVDVGDYFGQQRHIVSINLAVAKFVCQQLSITGSDCHQKQGSACLTPSQKEMEQVNFPLPEPPSASIQKVNQLLAVSHHEIARKGGKAPPRVALITGTTWPSKTWPWEHWCQLVMLLYKEYQASFCLIGSKRELGINAQIFSLLGQKLPPNAIVDLTDKTSLLDLVYLFEGCQLVVGPDSGPLHLAAAVGRSRVVGIYGSTPIGRLGPYSSQAKAVALNLWCQPCHEKVCPLSTTACLHELTAERVFEEIKGLIQD